MNSVHDDHLMTTITANGSVLHDRPATVLSIAPMCNYPPIDGASTRIISVAAAIGAAGYATTVIGQDFVLTAIPGQTTQVNRFKARWRSKREAAVRAICTAGHYPEIKYHNLAWERIVQAYVSVHRPDVLIANYVWTMGVVKHLPLQPDLVIYDTHNSEWQLYNNNIKESHNPIAKWIWHNAIARYDILTRSLPSNDILMHIAEADMIDHQARRPDLKHILVPACARPAAARTNQPDYTVIPKRLLFCGSLSGVMNVDALIYFAHEFWPTIQPLAQVTIAGSNPSRQVQRLCDQHAWRLEANFDSQRMAELYSESHFAILPFKHGAGSKLKLIEACSYGVPVLTTTAGNCGGLRLPPSVTISDNAVDWYHAVRFTSPCAEWAAATKTFCEEYAPARTINQLLMTLDAHIGHNI